MEFVFSKSAWLPLTFLRCPFEFGSEDVLKIFPQRITDIINQLINQQQSFFCRTATATPGVIKKKFKSAKDVLVSQRSSCQQNILKSA